MIDEGSGADAAAATAPGVVASGRRRLQAPGLVVAAATALVSGVSVFVNSYGVHAVRQPAVYTTAKNLVAALVLVCGAALVRARPPTGRQTGPLRAPQWAGLVYVGVVGGGVAFILFFTGLAHTTAEPAAFLHDSMVLWVALLAPAVLHERVSSWNVLAILLLVAGQVAVTGGIGHLVVGQGETMVLSATVLWALETLVIKRLLAVVSPTFLATARMGTGVAVLVVYLAVTNHLGALFGLDAHQLTWALTTGLLLGAYVATWMVALSRARAVDVTSVLVASVIVTSLLEAAAGHAGLASQALGLALVAAGLAGAVYAWHRPVLSRGAQAR